MRQRPIHRLLPGLAALLLAGCATNAAQLERGRAVSAAGVDARGKALAFTTRVRTARDEANIALVASDASCAWAATITLRGEQRVPPRGLGRPPLCLPLGTAADPELGDVEVPLRPVPESALRPTMAAIAALGAYLDAVNAVIEAPERDVAADIAEAYGLAIEAQAAIAGVTGADQLLLPELTGAQTDSVTALIKLIAELAAEQRKANELGRLIKAQDVEVQTVITGLRGQVTKWGAASLQGDLQLSDAVLTTLGRRLGDGQPTDPEARAVLIRKIIAAKRETAAVPATIAAVDAALAAMAKAQQELAAAYTANPNWTPAERAAAAKLNRQRLLGALRAIGGVFSAFGI